MPQSRCPLKIRDIPGPYRDYTGGPLDRAARLRTGPGAGTEPKKSRTLLSSTPVFASKADEELSFDTMAPRRNAATLRTWKWQTPSIAIGERPDSIGVPRLVRGLSELGGCSTARLTQKWC